MIGGLISAGLGLASSILGKDTEGDQKAHVAQGYDYLRDSPIVNKAQDQGVQAMGVEDRALDMHSDAMGLGGAAGRARPRARSRSRPVTSS